MPGPWGAAPGYARGAAYGLPTRVLIHIFFSYIGLLKLKVDRSRCFLHEHDRLWSQLLFLDLNVRCRIMRNRCYEVLCYSGFYHSMFESDPCVIDERF